jgi:serine/threonine-protein kinase
MPLSLRAVEGPNRGLSFRFEGPGTFLVGRSGRAQFQLPSGAAGDLRVSHIHCLVELTPAACRVHDLNSHNGTYLNGRRVTTAELRDGNRLRAGHTVFAVELRLPGETEAWPGGPDPVDVFAAPTVPPARPAAAPRPPRAGPDRRCAACRQRPPEPVGLLCLCCRAASDALPQRLPGYRLVRELGRGAMGVVHLAVRASDGAALAVKTLLTAAAPKPVQVQRFLREAGILKQLDHPNIVAFRETGTTPEGGLYLATDYVEGSDLDRVLKRYGPLRLRPAARAVCQVLQALEYAHAKRFVHRDIKPSNVLLRVTPRRKLVKLADFGLARIYQASQLSGMTLMGDVGGTPAFMAPEQIRNYREAEPAADLYSVAATLYNLLTGRYPYDLPAEVPAMFALILHDDPVPVRQRRPDLPRAFSAVLHQALSREPGDRFPSAREFRRELLPFTT